MHISSRSRSRALGQAELDLLYRRLRRSIRTLWRGGDADDIVQEAFLRLWQEESRNDVRDRAAFLHAAAFNLIKDRARAETRRAMLIVASDRADQVACAGPCSERVLAAREQLAIVHSAIAELPAPTRAALILARVEGQSHRQVAAQLSVSISMVEKQLRRAVLHCRRRLAERGGPA
jgi:RNA polymerase sigma-70 factor (ECF subfamily)